MTPCLVPEQSPLGQLEGPTNMVVLEGDSVGQIVLRGAGAGEALCTALIDQARTDGYRTLLLDTSKAFTGARALYKRLGFRERGPYQPVPDIAKDLLCYYEFTL